MIFIFCNSHPISSELSPWRQSNSPLHPLSLGMHISRELLHSVPGQFSAQNRLCLQEIFFCISQSSDNNDTVNKLYKQTNIWCSCCTSVCFAVQGITTHNQIKNVLSQNLKSIFTVLQENLLNHLQTSDYCHQFGQRL